MFVKLSGMTQSPPISPLDLGQAAPTANPSPTSNLNVLRQPPKPRSSQWPKTTLRVGRKSRMI